MKKQFLVLLQMVVITSVAQLTASPVRAAENSQSKRLPTMSGAKLILPNADLEKVARVWLRMFGGTVTIADRARERKVSIDISAPSKDELRKMLVSALRENGIVLVERSGSLVFDLASDRKQGP